MKRWRWILVFVAVAALDVALRSALRFDLHLVLPYEAMLFALGALPLLAPLARSQSVTGASDIAALVVAALLALAALRDVLILAGLAISRANVIVALGAVILIAAAFKHRRTSAAEIVT